MPAAVSFSPPDRNYVQFSNRFPPTAELCRRFKEADIDPDSLFRVRGWSFCRVRTVAPLWLRSSYCLADGAWLMLRGVTVWDAIDFPTLPRKSIPFLPPQPRPTTLIQFTDPTAPPSHSAGCSTRQISAPSFSRLSAIESQAGDKKRKSDKILSA